MSDLYKDLGVPPDASQEYIREQYRRQAKRHHPDKPTGDKEKFQIIQYAYDILGDPRKRARYDTGETAPEQSLRAMAVQNIAAMMIPLVGGAPNIASLDIIAELHKMMQHGQEKAKAAIKECKKNIKKFEKAKQKLIFKGKGESFLTGILDSQISLQKSGIEGAERGLEMGVEMQAILKEYECMTEEKSPLAPFIYPRCGEWK